MVMKAKTQWFDKSVDGHIGVFDARPELALALGAAHATISRQMTVRGMHLAVSDLVMVDGVVCSLQSCAVVDGRRIVRVEPMSLVEQISLYSSRWARRGNSSVAFDGELKKPEHPHCWVWHEDDSLLVLCKTRSA